MSYYLGLGLTLTLYGLTVLAMLLGAINQYAFLVSMLYCTVMACLFVYYDAVND